VDDRLMARAGGIEFRVTVEDAAVLAALREARKEIAQDVKRELLEIAQRVVVPAAKQRVPGHWGPRVTARSTTTNAYLTTSLRGMQARAFGLLEHGGTVRTPIRPRRRQALAIAPGIVRAAVTAPRHYVARQWLQKAVESQRQRIEDELAERVTNILQRRIDGAGAPG
jgi:hypothetical protein